MGFKIPSQRFPGWAANAYDFRYAFGGNAKGKLPAGPATAELNGHTLYLREAAPPVYEMRWGKPKLVKSSKHRVFCLCPTCHAEVPAGRTMQHKCKLPKE